MTPDPPVLLVVKRDKNSELLDGLLEENGYSVQAAASVHDTESALSQTSDVSVVILDIDGFPTNILSRVTNYTESGIPLVLLSRSNGTTVEQFTQRYKVEFLEKPVQKQVLLNTLEMIVTSVPSPNSKGVVKDDDART